MVLLAARGRSVPMIPSVGSGGTSGQNRTWRGRHQRMADDASECGMWLWQSQWRSQRDCHVFAYVTHPRTVRIWRGMRRGKPVFRKKDPL